MKGEIVTPYVKSINQIGESLAKSTRKVGLHASLFPAMHCQHLCPSLKGSVQIHLNLFPMILGYYVSILVLLESLYIA